MRQHNYEIIGADTGAPSLRVAVKDGAYCSSKCEMNQARTASQVTSPYSPMFSVPDIVLP